MALRTLPARLLPALPSAITDEATQVPRIPEWWPLTADPPEVRARARRARALQEALTGPMDGTSGQVTFPEGERPPARFTPANAPTLWYTLSVHESSPHGLVYRYDPGCFLHRELIRAVEEGFTEHADKTYAQEARHDDDSAPFAHRR